MVKLWDKGKKYCAPTAAAAAAAAAVQCAYTFTPKAISNCLRALNLLHKPHHVCANFKIGSKVVLHSVPL